MKLWSDYDWSGVKPVFIPDEKRQLARINYSEEFAVSMAYLRAIQRSHEISERALALTQAILELNPAHYSVWDYRFEIVKEIGNDMYDPKEVGLVRSDKFPPVGEDGAWLNEFTLDHPKNYQVWNYRQHLADPISLEFFRGELLLVRIVLEDDPKNFHAWSHFKWAVQNAPPGTYDVPGLLDYAGKLLHDDVWNNSAWSFRYFLFQHYDELQKTSELDFVTQKIAEAPQNEAAWSYGKGIFQPSEIQPLALKWSPISCRAKELLAALLREQSMFEEAAALYSELCIAEPVRSGYWKYMQAAAQKEMQAC